MRHAFVSLFLVPLFFWAATCVAADYYEFDQGKNNYIDPQIIDKPYYFHSIYGFLSKGEETIDYYSFTLDQYSEQMQIELLVSVREKPTFHPSLIFAEPNQSVMSGQVPFGFPPQVGGRVYTWPLTEEKKGDTTVWENFFAGPKILKDLTPNSYTIGIFDPTGIGGRYMLRVGSKKGAETIMDKFNAVIALARIKFLLY